MTATTHPFALSADQLAEFDEQGFIVLRGVVPTDVTNNLRDVFGALVDRLAKQWFDEGFVDATFEDLPFETRFAKLREQLPPRFATSWRKALVSRTVYDLWRQPQLLGPARSLVGDEVYAHGVWNGRPREPNTPIQKVLWHQDAHYYKSWKDTDGPLISVWQPLVPVDERSGCLQLAAGSHRAGYLPRVRGFNRLFTVAPEALEGYPLVTAEMNPGDVLIFNDLTLHQGLDNKADFVRWSIDIRFGAATPEIISKTPRGYYCFSATDPSRVEDYATWEARYDYDKVGLGEELEDVDPATYNDVDLDAVADQLHTSRSELEVF